MQISGLQESKAGLAVGKLRQHASKRVADLAKEIVRKWKTEVEREKQASGGGAKAASNGKTAGAFYSCLYQASVVSHLA